MTAQEFILTKLKNIQDFNVKSETELADLIFKFTMSKKFRKFKVDPEYQDHIRKAIQINIQNQEPIKFTTTFGSYKLWRLNEAPEPDWAELFALMYYANWLIPITKIYTPGVWFDFFTDGIIVDLINNVPKSDTDIYHQSLLRLIEFLKNYLPQNLHFTVNRVGDQYSSYEEFLDDLNDKIKIMSSGLENGLPILSEKDKHTIELNVKLKPEQDNDPEWREKVKLIHDAYFLIAKKRPYYRTPDKISVGCTPFPKSIAVGTTKTSVAKFWVGVGVLKKANDGFIEYVLSPSQLQNVQYNWENVSIVGLDGKNFKRIRVI